MNPSVIPATCSIALTAVLAAGISHWWSVRQFSNLLEHGVPVTPAPASQPEQEITPTLLASTMDNQSSRQAVQQAIASTGSKGQQEFFEALVEEIKQMKTQNRDLLDQLAETNRDMMRMQFRLDTHSESFRPLPVGQDKPFSRIDQGNGNDNGPGVLPPRAEPVRLPSYE